MLEGPAKLESWAVSEFQSPHRVTSVVHSEVSQTLPKAATAVGYYIAM